MVCSHWLSRVVTVTAVAFSLCAATGTNDQVNSNVDYGTFDNPSAYVRPRFRYWLPDASVSLTQVAADIKDAGSKGAGGVELLGWYLYGGINSFNLGGGAGSDWATYGWGTPAWKTVQDTALQAHQQNGLIMDIPLGPNQGSGVPAPTDLEGLQWDLQPFNVNIPIGGTFDGILPGWGTGKLVSASTGVIVASDTTVSPVQDTLSTSSLTDVTGQVDANGRISLSFPATAKGINNTLFAYYLIQTHYYEQNSPLFVQAGVPQSTPKTFVQNGSFVWDHFSSRGANVAIDFWNQYLLSGGSANLIKKVGNFLWEDSQEFAPKYIWWTAGLPSLFSTGRGYAINKYLPILVQGVSSSLSTVYVTDENDAGNSHIQDYRQTLTEANKIYLNTVVSWAKSLGVQYSAQVAYNLPLDMPALVPYVNAPETETLAFGHNIDGYRQYAGAANLAGKRVISSETGANFFGAYQQTIPFLLWDIKRSIVGGINQFVIHGLAFSGYYPNTTWPGFATFDNAFSEMHGPRQPGWDFYSDWLDYTARVQYVAQSGIPKIDVAFYLKATGYPLGTSYDSTDLEQAGFTYEYLSPDNLQLPTARVNKRVLAPSRQAFSALVVRAGDTMTVDGATKIAQYANKGLPIFFAGGLPTSFYGFNVSGAEYVNKTLTGLTGLSNVHVVPSDNLAASITSAGIQPRTQISSNGTWYTLWREVASQATTYVYIYNDATGLSYTEAQTTGSITFATTGSPYIYDAWTGDIKPITVYTQTKTSITIPFQLAGNQTTIVAFRQDNSYSHHPVLSQNPSNAVSVSPLTSRANGSSTYTVTSALPAAATMLGPWTLTIESWSAPSNLYTFSPALANTTYTLTSLVPWRSIPNASLDTTSGRGYYHTTFHWPPPKTPASCTGAVLDLGFIVHTARLYINGELLPPLDVTAAKADVGRYLKKGVNSVDVVVATPLGNAMVPVWFQVMSSGAGSGAPPPGVADYGLVWPVTLTPYEGRTYYV